MYLALHVGTYFLYDFVNTHSAKDLLRIILIGTDVVKLTDVNLEFFQIMTIRVSKICKCEDFFADHENKALVLRNVRVYLAEQKIPTSITEAKFVVYQSAKGESSKKCKLRKPNIMEKETTCDPHGVFFGVPLQRLSMVTVHLKTGQKMAVPHILHDLCCYVLQHADEKGIFRKQGSGIKQEEIKAKIEMSHKLPDEDFSVIDIAVIIKYFLRKLPTPLIPESHHNLFIACFDNPDKEDLIILSCLLLPVDHLNLLTFVMHFFEDVAAKSAQNKMTAYNIAVCVAPNVMPVYRPEQVMKAVGITEILIERSELIGMVPEFMTRKELHSQVPPSTLCEKVKKCLGLNNM